LVVSGWLIDKSAIARLHLDPNAEESTCRIERGLVRISTVTRLEVGYSARSAQDHRAADRFDARRIPHAESRRSGTRAAIVTRPSRGNAEARRSQICWSLPRRIAELTVLHIDVDFDLIADITGQPTERLAVD
jgi:hypothetical protein